MSETNFCNVRTTTPSLGVTTRGLLCPNLLVTKFLNWNLYNGPNFPIIFQTEIVCMTLVIIAVLAVRCDI